MSSQAFAYEPYKGERLGARHRFGVLFSEGWSRGWGHLGVKLCAWLGFLPAAAGFVWIGFGFVLGKLSDGKAPQVVLAEVLESVLYWEVVSIGLIVTTTIGATSLTEDRGKRLLVYYRTRQVSAEMLWAARAFAVSAWLFLLMFAPLLVLWGLGLFAAPEELRLDGVLSLLPSFVFCAIACLSMGFSSVSLSCLSSSVSWGRSAWLILLLVPEGLSRVVSLSTENNALSFAPLAALGRVSERLFALDDPTQGIWSVASFLLFLLAVLSFAALRSLRKAVAGAGI